MSVSWTQLFEDGRLFLGAIVVIAGMTCLTLIAIYAPLQLPMLLGFISSISLAVVAAIFVSKNGEKKLAMQMAKMVDANELAKVAQMAIGVLQSLQLVSPEHPKRDPDIVR